MAFSTTVQLRLITALCSVFLITACGGGSGDNQVAAGVRPNAPVVTADVSTKSLNLTWTIDSNAEHYKVYTDNNGSSGFTDVSGNLTGDTFSVPLAVHTIDWQNARFMVEACNATGCTPSTNIYVDGSVIDAIGFIKAGANDSNSAFGFGLAISADGSTLAVGAPKHDAYIDSGSESGAVFLFSSQDNEWTYDATINNPSSDAGTNDRFGYSLALSGDGSTLAIGAPFEDGGSTGINTSPSSVDLPDSNTKIDSGAAYLYTLSDSGWEYSAYVKASNADKQDYFGLRVALSTNGERLAVSAPYEASNSAGVNANESNNSIVLAGAVYVFAYSDAATLNPWIQEAYIKPNTASQKDLPCFNPRPPNTSCIETSPARFGYSLAFASNGSTLAIGAPGDNSAIAGINGNEANIEAKDSGAVSILQFTDSAWQHTAFIKASNPNIDDEFGYALGFAADGATLVVGAPYEDGNGSGTNSATQDNNDRENTGAAYTFSFDGSQWTQQDYLKATNTETGDYFGWDVALSGDGETLAIGSPRDDSNAIGVSATGDDNDAENAGAAYVYTRANQAWEFMSYVKASNTNSGDTFGRTVALSHNGSTLAVAATGEDSNAEEVGGEQNNNENENSGAVYLY